MASYAQQGSKLGFFKGFNVPFFGGKEEIAQQGSKQGFFKGFNVPFFGGKEEIAQQGSKQGFFKGFNVPFFGGKEEIAQQGSKQGFFKGFNVPFFGGKEEIAQQGSKQGFFKGFNVPFFGGKEEIAEEFRFILVGKTGSGKSMTGNTILGKDLFTTSLGFGSVTTECERQKNIKNGKAIEIMDCPGLYDTSRSQQDISHVIVKAVACSHPGPHAILFVIRLGRFTAEENGVYDRLKALFDDDIAKYIVVIFTGGDDLARNKSSLVDLLKNAPRGLIDLLNECKNRCVVFDNTAQNKKPQVEELLEQVRRVKEENGDTPYICPKYIVIGQRLEEEINKRLQEVTDRDREKEQHIQQLKKKTQEIQGSVEELKEELKKKEEEIKKITEEKKKIEAEIQKLRQELKETTEDKKKELALLKQRDDSLESFRKHIQEEMEAEAEKLVNVTKKMEELEEERFREELETKRRRILAYHAVLDRMKQGIAQDAEEGWVNWAANFIAAPFQWVDSLFS